MIGKIYPLFVCCNQLLDGLKKLVADALHATDGWVPVLLVDVVQFNQLDDVMLAVFLCPVGILVFAYGNQVFISLA